MRRVIPRRMTARIEGDFVVFLIGMRINRPWRVDQWLPIVMAFPRMLRELAAHPESGYLGGIPGISLTVQYWRSFDHLEAYARDRDRTHWPAWVDFNRRVAANRGDVGIWHETYQVRAGEYETLYSGMPPHGLGSAGELVPAVGGLESARARLRRPADPAAQKGEP